MLNVHRAHRADGLIDGLVELLKAPLDDPFRAEVIAVPTHGVERFVTQRLSHHLGATGTRHNGVCANVVMPTPRRLVDGVVAALNGFDVDGDPWVPSRLVWPLLDEVADSMDAPEMHRLAAHLDQQKGDRSRRFRVVRHLASLFDGYATHRPDMLRAWALGRDEDGDGKELDPEHVWQAQLWRQLADRVGAPDPVACLDEACTSLAGDPLAVSLPERLSIFGLTSLSARELELLSALARGRDVHLFLLHPSDTSWRRVAEALDDRDEPIVKRSGAAAIPLPANPLLASWAHDARELQIALADQALGSDVLHPVPDGEDTLLARLQADVRADRPPRAASQTDAEDQRPALAASDVSVQIHSCHGRARQVEVLRDAILHALADDPTLEPRDIVVMCADLDSFAPLIEATFGGGDAFGDQDRGAKAGVHALGLRVRLADRAPHERNAVLGVARRLLELVTARVTASEVLDLGDREPVRRRFGFGHDDMARLEAWVSSANVRWGLDGEHRRVAYGLDQIDQGTWKAGFDRLLVGVAMAEGQARTVAGVLPLDDVGSSDIELAGRFAELVERLQATLGELSGRMTIDKWVPAISRAVDLLTASSESEQWQRSELERMLHDILGEATINGKVSRAALDVADVIALLDDRLIARPTRANFRTGHLTVCTMRPMRTVPYRVVCLLGLDDGAFPRSAPHDGDDLLWIEPRIGDRDPRVEDRQILLDALMGATDRVIITYTGNDERTNAESAVAVPVGELLDVIERTACVEHGPPRDKRILVRHPLQPFDRSNFEPGALIAQTSWSFDTLSLKGALARDGDRDAKPSLFAEPLPYVAAPVIELDKLVKFFEHPIRAFLRQRLGVVIATNGAAEVRDALPIELSALESWGVGHRLLTPMLDGIGSKVAGRAERARGVLPPGEMREQFLRELAPKVMDIAVAAQELDVGEPRSIDINVALGEGRRLRGTVTGVRGDVLAAVTYSAVDARHRLRSWIRLLALTAMLPERPFTACTIGRPVADGKVAYAETRMLADEPEARRAEALAQLAILVELFDRGMSEPLPLFSATSMTYATGSRTNAMDRARAAWTTSFDSTNEDLDAEHRLIFGGVRSFEEILAEAPRDDEGVDADWNEEETRFGRYALRLWTGPVTFQKVRTIS